MNSCDLEISHDTRTPPPDKISHDRRDPWGRKHEGKTGRMIGRMERNEGKKLVS